MNFNGIIRRVDELGRVVIPIEIRKILNIKEGESLEFNIENKKIVISKRQITDLYLDTFNLIGNSIDSTIEGKFIITDREKVLVSSNKGYINLSINDFISKLLVCNDEFIKVDKIKTNFIDIDNICYLFPYYFESIVAGYIILYDVNDINKYIKLVKFICSYIHDNISLS